MSEIYMFFRSDIKMDCAEIDVHETEGSSTETHKSFLLHYDLWGGEFLKRILYIALNIIN